MNDHSDVWSIHSQSKRVGGGENLLHIAGQYKYRGRGLSRVVVKRGKGLGEEGGNGKTVVD